MIEGLDHLQTELIRQGKHIRNLTARVRKLEITVGNINFRIADNTNAVKFLSSMFGVLLSDLNRYLMLYESILSELDHFWMHWTTCPTISYHISDISKGNE